jgi:hypothetical protein
LLCLQFFLVSVWMTLCGPATEAHTYLLMAPALVLGLVKSIRDPQSVLLRTLVFTASFLQVLHWTRIDHHFHNKHEWVFIPLPLSALLFLGYCLLWFWLGQSSSSSSSFSSSVGDRGLAAIEVKGE